MKMKYICPFCDKEKWFIDYDHEEKIHNITCVNCNKAQVIEDITGKRRRITNAKRKQTKQYKRDNISIKQQKEPDKTGQFEHNKTPGINQTTKTIPGQINNEEIKVDL